MIKFAPMNKTITILLAALTIMSCANNAKQAQSLKDKPWQEIAPTEIELNPVQMMLTPMTAEEYRKMALNHFPMLKRWRR